MGDPWFQRPQRGQGLQSSGKRLIPLMTGKSQGLFKCAAQTGVYGRNEISGKDYVMEIMKVYKMKNRKESKTVSIKGEFFCSRLEGREGEGDQYK